MKLTKVSSDAIIKGEGVAIWHDGRKYIPVETIVEMESALFEILDHLGTAEEMRQIAENVITRNQ
ncbi:hypothetical protein [uncultured Roseibium sp.]|uniref:hypothetical protein n=1 Tax=uncultured Roseibium sp. TaxID=1936171 RepID=UPI0026077332|nr:hypothetical protein [uncultured Roseibium sp.]